MSSAEELLRDAEAAHRAGRLAAAEAGYRRVLRKQPADHRALLGLGVLSVRAGARAEAVDYLLRSLVSAPNDTVAWNWLGAAYVDTGRLVEGRAAFLRATELSPELPDAWCNLANCSRREGNLAEAVEHLRRAAACPTVPYRVYEGLVSLLCEQGRVPQAAQVAAEWLARDPSSPIARHLAAALSGQEPPARASDEYVRAYFDGFAEEFDSTLALLDYRGPQLAAAALRDAASRAPAVSGSSGGAPKHSPTILNDVLDAGCGTGLCGPLIRELSRSLVGVDLSPAMIERARQRRCYDELVGAELSTFMRSRPGAFDAIVCVDTLVYFGALAEPLAAARAALREGGPLIFTVEALPQSDPEEYRLGITGRYSHGEAYLRRVSAESGFMIESIGREALRSERGAEVMGHLVVARRM